MRRFCQFFCTVALLLSFQAISLAAPDSLLQPPPEAPQYRLSNLRLEDGQFGRPNLVFDYVRTREGAGRVQLAGRSSDGPLRITFLPDVNKESGEIRLSKMHSFGRGTYDYEFYLVTPAHWAGESYGNCLVSNTVRMGNPGSGAAARQWNAEEKAAHEKQQLADTPPASLPEGHKAVTTGTWLLPGMIVKAGRYADWVDAEVLSLVPINKVTIRYADQQRGVTLDREDWLAVDPKVLQQAEADPEQFQPSMRVLPGGSAPLPKDAVAIDADLDLPRGAPLLLHRGDWEKVYVVDDRGIVVKVRYSDHPGKFEWEHKRTELAIRRETLETLNQPDSAKEFLGNLGEGSTSADDDMGMTSEDDWGQQDEDDFHVTDRNYPIKVKIPRGAQLVPKDIELPKGVAVAYCWARSWEPSTLIEDRGSKLIVKENDNVSSFVWRLDREQVIIQDKTLRKLRRLRTAKAKDFKTELRTWTDSSGQHKIEARFVRLADDEVTLKTDGGKEIVLSLKKLSDEDRELLKDVEPEVENPFE